MDYFQTLQIDEQLDLLMKCGTILISSCQGTITRTYYSLYDFFARVTRDENGGVEIEVLPNLEDLHLYK